MNGCMPDVTQILSAIDAGDPHAAEQLLPLVYDELRKLAAAKLAHEKPGQTLDATALVHEAYLRLLSGGREPPEGAQGADAPCSVRGAPEFANRRHYFAAAAEAMRRILVESARRKRRLRHGGERQRVELDPDMIAVPERDERLLALDDALARFAVLEPEKAELVKLRSFAGLSLDQAAEVLGISASTADRWWGYARAWLRVDISGEKSP
jgi:RNA polymerase sigma factor (sigma-70 family)